MLLCPLTAHKYLDVTKRKKLEVNGSRTLGYRLCGPFLCKDPHSDYSDTGHHDKEHMVINSDISLLPSPD